MSHEPVISMTRKYVHPRGGDSLRDIAARELPHLDVSAGVDQLLLWNLHLANRLNATRSSDTILASDIVFVEPGAPS